MRMGGMVRAWCQLLVGKADTILGPSPQRCSVQVWGGEDEQWGRETGQGEPRTLCLLWVRLHLCFMYMSSLEP